MVPTLQREDRSEVGVFAPIDRPRLVERLAASAAFPVALLIAPAGYGKSVALRQYLASLREPNARFGLRAEHATLLGFLRGLAEALRDKAPHAITALAGAYERNQASPKRSTDLARWMHAHLESFSGTVAIDDLHLADGDLEVARFLIALIERTKGRIHWILASRSTTGLPVGTWLAYRDADLPIGEHDLRFTPAEAREAAAALGLTIREDELTDLLALTEGWPAAMSFALRTSTRSSELRNVSAMTREMIYRLLAEQVYADLDEGERNLLEVGTALPTLDVGVLERAGFDRALPIIERLRERTAFIYEESPGIYQCHDLFRDFLRHQTALGGKRAHQIVHERAARALEANADVEHAIASYVIAGASADVVRLLEQDGFDLLERARGDVIAHAIESLDEKTRRENPSVLALQGALQAIAGKFARAESLFRRSLARSGSNRDLVAIASLRLASVVGNQGQGVSSILEPIAGDDMQRADYRAEALSLIAAQQAISGDLSSARAASARAEGLLAHVETDGTRARILHHLGIVSRHAGEVGLAYERLSQSSELAAELHLYSTASRAYAVLSNLTLHAEDNVERQLLYAELAADAGAKAGDAFAIQTALLQMLSAYMREGDIQNSIAIERRLATVETGPLVMHYVAFFRSVRLGWEGRFAEARRLLAACWRKIPSDLDRACAGAHQALFLALDGHRGESVSLIRETLALLPTLEAFGLFDVRSLTISRVFCALADLANGRRSHADRIAPGIDVEDEIEKLVGRIVRGILCRFERYRAVSWDDVWDSIEALSTLGYADIAGIFKAAYHELRRRQDVIGERECLTPCERNVLRLLAGGLAPKEIAAESDRSVHTIRVHIANAIQKLGCHGHAQAIEAARQLGLI
jgi:ATP/maltotriose-dependent transcriptional regulator MalT